MLTVEVVGHVSVQIVSLGLRNQTVVASNTAYTCGDFPRAELCVLSPHTCCPNAFSRLNSSKIIAHHPQQVIIFIRLCGLAYSSHQIQTGDDTIWLWAHRQTIELLLSSCLCTTSYSLCNPILQLKVFTGLWLDLEVDQTPHSGIFQFAKCDKSM